MGSSEVVADIWQQALGQRLKPGQRISFTVSIKTERRLEEGRSGMASHRRMDGQIAALFRGRWGIRDVETRRRADQTSFIFTVSESFAERRMLEAHERNRPERQMTMSRAGQLVLA